MTYTEHRAYSVMHDCLMARVSVFRGGREYFAMVAAGAGYRKRRADALDLIRAAIDAGLEPGEVIAA